MSDSSGAIVVLPAGKPNGSSIRIDMGYWASLETRIEEVATVTPTKAPELLATFNRSALELDRLANELELDTQNALRAAERIKSIIILDKVPAILKEKGLVTERNPMGSVDLREAILGQDPEYITALEKASILKAMTRIIRGKYDAFERAFRAVKTLVGEQNFNYGQRNPNLTGTTGSSAPGAAVPVQGFGSPKYR
jgi:hypothetical protein